MSWYNIFWFWAWWVTAFRSFPWDVIAYPCPNFNKGLTKTSSHSGIDIKTNNDDAFWHNLYPYYTHLITHEDNYVLLFTAVAMVYHMSFELLLKMQNNIRQCSAIYVLDCIRLHCLRKLQCCKSLQDNPCKMAYVTTMYLCRSIILRLAEDRPNIHVNAILHSCLQAREQPWVVSMKIYMNTGIQVIHILFC